MKFRLYPNQYQWKKIHNTLDVCRWVYNKMVNQTRNGFVTRNDLNYFLTELKEQEPWLYSYHSKMLQMISTQIDGAQKSLIQLRKNGYAAKSLKFARYSKYRTFTYNQSGFKIQNGFLYLSKIGKIKIIQHRQIPENSKIKQVIITKSKSGKWYACITCNIETDVPKINLSKAVGIDVGIKTFAYDSDGHRIPNQLNLKKMLKPLARAQRKISRRKKGSNNRLKAIKHMQRIHERIKNRRKDFLHKLSTQYAKKYDRIFMEKLEKLNMVKNHHLARNILDSGWEIFSYMVAYKTTMIEVPARNTTIDCSRCGNKVPKSLAVRIHRCNVCNLVIDRDYNASINILKRGLSIFNISAKADYLLPQELREVTPVEISMRSLKQEEAINLFGGSSLKDSRKV
ncbi:Putative transposase in snaA-snaB intergenic region protein [Marine Group I thaumarchaeote SCGC AAA799-N04]|nr:Putative transposase in snaA-snaB intergenic region protein [Marine Group I thaumarchaeote SCGC AAA799-N04]KFM14528.1 putative transposase in snaA-snaB intergenic region protein [Marine Group I thaumarchaeote SCGC AAA799-D11]